MKRLIPATITLVLIFILCIYSNIFIKRACDNTLEDIKNFQNQTISAKTLQNTWQKRKEKMSFFINHGFLDDISLHIGQLSVENSKNSEYYAHIYKDIETILSMIKEEQRLSAHSFY